VLSEAIRLAMAGVLLASSIAKLARPGASMAALSTFGVDGARRQGVVWAALIVAEAALAIGVAAGSALAAYLAAALLTAFAAAVALALRRGRAGAPCACFGVRSKVGQAAVGRNALLAAAFLIVAILP
jgi:hypothetical protein